MNTDKLTLMRAVGKAHREWRRHTKKCAHEVGIPESYLTIIMFLSKKPGANQRMIAEFTDTTTAAVNQVVKKMINSGYVRKETSSSDGRSTCLYLTDDALDKSDALRDILARSDSEITDFLGEDREGELIGLLSSISAFIGEL